MEVCVRLPQIVHLHYQELVAALAHLVLELFNFWLDLLKTDGILADGLRRMLHVKDHVVELVDSLDVEVEVFINVRAEQEVDHVFGEECVVNVVLEQSVELPLVRKVETFTLMLQVAHLV